MGFKDLAAGVEKYGIAHWTYILVAVVAFIAGAVIF